MTCVMAHLNFFSLESRVEPGSTQIIAFMLFPALTISEDSKIIGFLLYKFFGLGREGRNH